MNLANFELFCLETEAEVSLYLNENPETELVKCQGT